MTSRSHAFSLITITLFIVLTYANSFTVPFQFDDLPNIVDNRGIHIQKINLNTLFQTFYTNPSTPDMPGKRLNRPIAYGSFALNWFWGKESVWGYHLVNGLLHLGVAFLLYGVILKLVSIKSGGSDCHEMRSSIALISTLFWAINPVQTQAVTYIVQRMALFAAFFYIGGIYFYLKAKEAKERYLVMRYRLLLLLSYLLAMGSKENAITLPFSLLLLEMCFFKMPFKLPASPAKRLLVLIIGGGILIGGVLYGMMPVLKILDGYHGRIFTLTERVLTQPRVLCFYLSLIFFPLARRLSIDHDIIFSTGLFTPLTTFGSISIILMVIVYAFIKRARYPYFSFATLFFFLNHLIESSILPIEMVFEHRNYLPSLFLFLPVAVLWAFFYQRLKKRSPLGKWLMLTPLLSALLFFSSQTILRNRQWQSVESLWMDAHLKAPFNVRPVLHLAFQKAYGPQAGKKSYDEALALYQKALHLKSYTRNPTQSILDNIAGIYVRKGKYTLAIQTLQKLLKAYPNDQRARWGLVRNLIRSGRFYSAEKSLSLLLSAQPEKVEYLHLKGHIRLRQRAFKEALVPFEKCLNSEHLLWKTLFYMGVTYSEMGLFEDAHKMLIGAFALKKDYAIYASYIQNLILSGKQKEADEKLAELQLKFAKEEIMAYFKKNDSDMLSVQPSFQVLLLRLMDDPPR